MIELILLVAGLIVVVFLMSKVSKSTNGLNRQYYTVKWQNVENTFTHGESGMRMAVIDADKLVDHALKNSRVSGETMGDRLKQVTYLRSIDNLWTAHKLRNKLVHEPDMKPKAGDMKRALSSYKKSLKELGAL